MKRYTLNIIGIFLLGAGGGVFADQILWPYITQKPIFDQPVEPQPIYLTETTEIQAQENTALQFAVEKVEKTAVGVRAVPESGPTYEGSGLIVTSDGLLVSLAEILPQGADFFFYTEGAFQSYQVLKRDMKHNLALVKIEKGGLSTTGFVETDNIKMGERVFLVGTKEAKEKFVNEGIIKSFSADAILTSISAEKGVEGSPLFNIEGRVVGINFIDKEGQVSAIPAAQIREFVGF